MLANTELTDFTIANGGTTSNAVDLRGGNFYSIAIQGPAALTTAVTVQVTLDGTNYRALQSGGADVTVAALKVLVLSPCPYRGIRVVAAGAEAAERVFEVHALRQYEGRCSLWASSCSPSSCWRSVAIATARG